MDDRKEFLLQMYGQMFNDIDRHHKLVWETLSVLVGAFAVLALVEKEIISIDMATAIIVLLACWVIMHVYDSNYWYNRNLSIISNIERQFLSKEDLRNIHYYFGKHRDKRSIQTSLKIQIYFCLAIIILFLLYHFLKVIVPGFKYEFTVENINEERVLPYFSLVMGLIFICWIKKKRTANFLEFLRNSPGIKIDTSQIKYGKGHPTSS